MLQGSSQGQFYAEWLQPILLSQADVDWESEDLSYLTPDAYRERLLARLTGAPHLQNASPGPRRSIQRTGSKLACYLKWPHHCDAAACGLLCNCNH